MRYWRRGHIRMASAIAIVMAVGGISLATAGPAGAFPVAGAARLSFVFPRVTVKPGATVNLTNAVSLQFTDNPTSAVWAAGDKITFQLWDASTNQPLSVTTSQPTRSASFTATPTVAASGITAPTIALAKSSASGVDDEFVLTFPSAAPKDTDTHGIGISGLSIALGLGLGTADPGHAFGLHLVASNGTPFSVPTPVPTKRTNAADATAVLGYLAEMNVQAGKAAIAAPGQVGVPLGDMIVSGPYAGDLAAGDHVTLTLSSGTWVNLPNASGAPAISGLSGSGTPTLAFDVLAPSIANDSLILSGATVDVTSTLGPVTVAFADGPSTGSFIAASVVRQNRIAGADRYATGSALFDSAFGTTAAVVLTSGVNFPDALSANYLARGLATGILATDPNVLPPSTQQAILTHHVQEVYVVGGATAVSDAVVHQIEGLHVGGVVTAAAVRVARIGGSNRYATNELVDTYAHAKSMTAIIATGEQFADALSVGPAVYVSGYPLVLTSGATLAPSASATLGALGVKSVIIVGGTSAVSATVESQLRARGIAVVERLAGADRTQTAGLIATWEEAGTEAQPPYINLQPVWAGTGATVDIVRGDSFADALVAGPVAGHGKNVILMTTDPSNLGAGIPAFLGGGGGQVSYVRTVQAVGGTTAVTDATLAAATQSIN